MPTDKPKISAYVPQVLKDKVSAFQEERRVSESQAVTIILAEYFGVQAEVERVSHGAEVGGVSLAAFQELQSQVQELMEWKQRTKEKSEVLSNLSHSLQEPDNKPAQLELLSESPSELLEIKPISGMKLSEYRFGLSKSAVAGTKGKKSTKEFTEWSREKDPDGIGWKPVKAGYVPEGELSNEQQSSLLKWIKENTG